MRAAGGRFTLTWRVSTASPASRWARGRPLPRVMTRVIRPGRTCTSRSKRTGPTWIRLALWDRETGMPKGPLRRSLEDAAKTFGSEEGQETWWEKIKARYNKWTGLLGEGLRKTPALAV